MRLVILGIVVMALAACTFVTPQNAALFDSKAANARALDRVVATRPDVPADVKTAIHLDANYHTYESDWANGRNPTEQP